MSDTPPYPTGPQAPYQPPAYPQPVYPPQAYPQPAYPPQAYPPRTGEEVAPRTAGVVSLILALAALVGATALSGITSFAAATGAARHGFALAPDGLDNLSNEQLLALLSPVRDLVLWAEIGFWAGTVLGIAAIVIGIVAIVRRAGRGPGIAAIVVAAAAPVVYVSVVTFAIVMGVAAGAM